MHNNISKALLFFYLCRTYKCHNIFLLFKLSVMSTLVLVGTILVAVGNLLIALGDDKK